MLIVAVHAEKSHNMKEVPTETVDKTKKAVKN